MNVSIPALPDSIPPSILASADLLVTKTAYLAGMVAPETAACLCKLLMGSDADFSRIIDGYHTQPEFLKTAFNAANQQFMLEKVPELRRRIVTTLAHHFHTLQTHAFPNGKGVVARAITHQHLTQLGLHPHLWSLARGLARRREEYQALAPTHRRGVTEPTVGGQPSGKSTISFIEFMLEVCLEEANYMTAALNRGRLREAVMHAPRTHSRFIEAEIEPQTVSALLALLMQGALPVSEFEIFTGHQPNEARDQLIKLINIGLAVKSASYPHMLQIGIPSWFARDIFPDFTLANSDVRSPLP